MKKRIAITVIGIMLIICGVVQYAKSKPEAECIEYTVSEGDTLWEIAEDVYGSDTDTRKAVYEIRKVNGCTGEIYPGDVLKIPEKGVK